ncbi:hypothetical protein Tco_1359912 [Tanacetum coccineum]
MAAIKFASSHNMVTFLDKATESDGFEKIVDFLNAHPIKYELRLIPQSILHVLSNSGLLQSVPTHSNDPLLSGEDRLKLNELMELCTSLSQRVLDLEKTKTSQAAEITELKERVKKLEKKGGSRTHRLRRLYKVGRSTRVVSSKDEGLGDQEDASKQGRKLMKLIKISLINEQDLAEKEVTWLIRMIVLPDPVTTNGEVVIANVEEEKLARQREEDVNIAEWDNVQAIMDANYELATRLQAEEQGELTIEEKSRLFVELMDKRKKHFARLRAKEQRRKPATKAQKRNTILLLTKNMKKSKHFVDICTELMKGIEDKQKEVLKEQEKNLNGMMIKKKKNLNLQEKEAR